MAGCCVGAPVRGSKERRRQLIAAGFQVEILTVGRACEHTDPPEPGTCSADVVTLVTQCSEDRLGQLERTAARWTGPIAAAVLVQSSVSVARARVKQWLSSTAAEGCWRCVLLVQDRRRPDVAVAAGALYPINALRNLALAAVETDLLLVVDVDQVPSAGLANALQERAPTLLEALLSSCTALVVPAFEPVDGFKVVDSELTARNLADWRRDGSVATFGATTYPPGHGSTDESGWLPLALHQEPTPLDPRDWPQCPYSEGYEPYLIVSRVGAPPFDERYEGYGRNKIAWVRHLNLLGFSFFACPFGYLMHQPHAPSAALGEFKARRMHTIFELDATAAAELKADPCRIVCRHAPVFIAAEQSLQGMRQQQHADGERNRSFSRTAKGARMMSTQLGRWRTVSAATTVNTLLAQAAVGGLARSEAAARLQQIFYLKHEFDRDTDTLHPTICSIAEHRMNQLSGEEKGYGHAPPVWVATHASLDYVAQLEMMVDRWTGPMSIAIVVTTLSDLRAARRAAALLARRRSSPALAPLLVTAVVVDWRRDSHKSGGLLYPSNLARKVAFDAVPKPSWVWLLDADLCPCIRALERIQAQLRDVNDTATVVVTPTFEYVSEAMGSSDIEGKSDGCADLLDCNSVRMMVVAGELVLFHSQNFREGHGATDLEQWLRQGQEDGSGSGKPYEITYEIGFEPFALLHTDLAVKADTSGWPLFETSFRHPHKDKCAVYMRVSFSATKFVVVPDVCLIAPAHTPSTLRRGEQLSDGGDLFAKAAGEARFVSYYRELSRSFGSPVVASGVHTEQDDKFSSKREEQLMLVREVMWRGDPACAEPCWAGWPVVGGIGTLSNIIVDVDSADTTSEASFQVKFTDGQVGLQTKLLLPKHSCDNEAGLTYQVYFPSSFPLADSRGGKLLGLALTDTVKESGDCHEPVACCFRWTAQGSLCFGIEAMVPSEVEWERANGRGSQTEQFSCSPGATKFLWRGPILRESWMSLKQELLIGRAQGTVEVRAAVNGIVVVDAVIRTLASHVAEPGGIGRGLGDWEWENAQLLPGQPACAERGTVYSNAQRSGRFVAKLHVFASYPASLSEPQDLEVGSNDDHCMADDGAESVTPWLALRSLAATGSASGIDVVMVVGFHHSGTSLLRHIIGSHPQAHEHVPEIFPTPAQLRILRNQTAAAGKSTLVIKHPVNNTADLKHVAWLQEANTVKLVYIRRNLPDVIFSLARRHGCEPSELESEVAAWRDVDTSDVACHSPSVRAVVQLEDLLQDHMVVLGQVCAGLGLQFDEAMVKRPQRIVTSNQGTAPCTDHDRRRMAQVNAPLQKYDWHPWQREGASKAAQSFLSQLQDSDRVEEEGANV
eukprot:COSAG02_NODE_726_length_18005_cov_69.224897_1_plen_1352_part_00